MTWNPLKYTFLCPYAEDWETAGSTYLKNSKLQNTYTRGQMKHSSYSKLVPLAFSALPPFAATFISTYSEGKACAIFNWKGKMTWKSKSSFH